MQFIRSSSEESIFKTQFTGGGIVILGLLVLSVLALCERLLYDLGRITLGGSYNYYTDLKLITIHAIAIICFLVISLVVNYAVGRKKEKYALVLIPYFMTAILLSIQLSLQIIYYFTTHHTEIQFYVIMSLLVVISTYSIYHIQKRFNRKDMQAPKAIVEPEFLPFILGGILLLFILIMLVSTPTISQNERTLFQTENSYNRPMMNQGDQFPKGLSRQLVANPSLQPFQFTSNLSVGSESEEVLMLKDVLATENLLPIAYDERYNDETKNAVMLFQARYTIPQTGNVDNATRAVLNTKVPDPKIPRVIFWYGAINKYWDIERGNWVVDPSNSDYGADVDKLAFCKRWYPETKDIRQYKVESSKGWLGAGHQGNPNMNFTAWSYQCIQ